MGCVLASGGMFQTEMQEPPVYVEWASSTMKQGVVWGRRGTQRVREREEERARERERENERGRPEDATVVREGYGYE